MMMQQEHMLGKTMHMSVKWPWHISFVFEQLTVNQDQVGLIILGLVTTVVVSVLSVGLPAIKNYVNQKMFGKNKNHTSLKIEESQSEEGDSQNERQKSKGQIIFNFFYILLYSVLQILTMMLIMTYNGYVIIAVMIGLTIGYTVFGMESDKDKNIPVNCCA